MDSCIDHGLNQKGYGEVMIKGRRIRLHRLTFERHYGPIPDGLHVLHYCDNPRCVNPLHLYVGTHTENMRDKRERGRQTRNWNPYIKK